MTSNDELTISDLFDFAFDLQQKLESNKIEQKLETFNSAIERLKLAEEKIDELHLFSDNEEINEVSSNELRYFILYALIGWLYEYRSSNREQRSDDIHLSISYFIKYLQLCKNYGLVQHIPKEQDDDTDKFRLHPTEDRQTKIQK
jgi:immunoglobulin-binding protein 1